MMRKRLYRAGELREGALIQGRFALTTVLAVAMLLLVGCAGSSVGEPSPGEQGSDAGSGSEPAVAEEGLRMVDEEFAFAEESADFCFQLLEIDALRKFSSVSIGLVIADPAATELAADLVGDLRSLSGLPADFVEPNAQLAESIAELAQAQSAETVADLAEAIRLWSDVLARHCELV